MTDELPICPRLVRRSAGRERCGRTSEYAIHDPDSGELLGWACHLHRTDVTRAAPEGTVLVDHRLGEERVPARLLRPGDRISVHNVGWTVEGVGEVFPGHPFHRLQVAYLYGPGQQFDADEPVWRTRVVTVSA